MTQSTSGNIQDLLTPAHPNRSGGLVLRAGLKDGNIVYYQSEQVGESERHAWKYYRDATTEERRMIASLVAMKSFSQVQISSAILFFRKSGEGNQ